MPPASSDQHSSAGPGLCGLSGPGQSEQSCAGTALRLGASPGPALDCWEQLGGDSDASMVKDERQLWEERSQRVGCGKLSHTFSFGRLGPPLGSPTKPRGFISSPIASPAAPSSPAQALAPPSVTPGPGSPRSVRLTGSVRLVGDQILPPLLPPPAAVAPAAALPAQTVSSLLDARSPPFSGAGSPGAGLQVLESHLVREPSLRDLLQQRQLQQPQQPQLPPLKGLPVGPPPSLPPPQPPAGTSPAPAALSPPTPDDQPMLASPRKRARKGLPSRAASDEMELCSPFALCQVSDDVIFG